MVIQRRYVKLFRIMQNDPKGKAILYKAYSDESSVCAACVSIRVSAIT